jgi:capsular exopolysaccharide synthesis family protein
MPYRQKHEAHESPLDTEEVLDLGYYWQVFVRYIWRILGLAIFLTVLVALFVLSMTPRYVARASLLIEAEEVNVLSIEEIYGLDSSRKEYYETQYEVLRSRQIAEKLVDEMQLHKNKYFNLEVYQQNKSAFSKIVPSTKEWLSQKLPFLPQKPKVTYTEEEQLELEKQFAVYQVMSNLSIRPVNNTQVVHIVFESESPQLSAKIANTVADVYIENYLESKLDMTAKATTWLNESLQGLRNKLDVAEENLAKFYEQEQVVDIDGVVGLASERLQGLSEELLNAQVTMQRNETIYNQAIGAGTSTEQLASLPEVLNHPSIQSIKREEVAAQSKISELREVYGPKHPTMIAANAELTSIKQSILMQTRELISGITSEYESAKVKVAGLTRNVEEAKVEFRTLTNLENRRRALQREVDINQQLYDSFFTRLKETDQLGGFESANARVLDAAVPPSVAAKPKKTLIVVAAFITSFGFGIFLALLLDILNSGIRSSDDVERKLSQRMLGLIPWQPHKRKQDLELRHFFDKSHHSFSEAVRTLRTSLQLLTMDKPAQTILITSSVPKEGKSTVTVNLAFAIGQLNKVLVLDTDLRRPTIGKLFGLPGFQPGLANLIAGTHSFDECVVTDEQSGVDVICAGTLPPNPQELLASKQFSDLVISLREQYEYIIIDSAPTQAVSDSVIVSKVADSVVYVVKADSTNHKVINQGLSRFLQIGHRVDGVVLNQVDLNKAKKSGAYSGFYDQYGYNTYTSDKNSSNS